MVEEARRDIFATAFWLDLLAKRFKDDWPEVASQAESRAKRLREIIEGEQP